MADDSGYRWYCGTLADGRLTTQLPVTSTSWSDVMDDAGSLSVQMQMSDPDVAALRPYLVAEPCRCFLAVAYIDADGTETFLAGGPIWSHSYDGRAATRPLTIGAAGLWSYWDHRFVLPVLAAGVSPSDVTVDFGAASLGTIAKRLVALAQTHTGGQVPVVLPVDVAGTDTRSFDGGSLTVTGQALRDLTGVDGGPEIQFVPRRRADDGRYIEWVMRHGTPAAPLLTQTGDDWALDTSAARSIVSALSAQRDGSSMGTRAWMQGAGTSGGTLFGKADSTTLTSVGFRLLEVAGSGTETETSQAALDKASTGLLQKSSRPSETWSIKVRRDGPPSVAAYAVGDWLRITVAGDPYIPDGDYRTRITSKSGDDSRDVTVALQPMLGAV